jgi:hypothetical protein
VEWLAAYGAWARDARATHVAGERWDCDRAPTGAPPTARFQGVVLALRAACAAIEEGAPVARDAFAAIDRHVNGMMLAGAPLPTTRGGAERSHVDPTYADAVRRRAGDVDGRTVCWSEPDWERLLREEDAASPGWRHGAVGGFVAYRPLRVDARPRDGVALERAAHAVQALAHESEHAAGVRSEAAAECYAVQRLPAAASVLGVAPAYARALQRAYWERGYPREPDEYRSADCADGRGLDLRPHEPGFP